MLFVLGSVLAGVLLYNATRGEREASAEDVRQPTKATVEDTSTVVYHTKSGEGEVSLPPCKLMAVELGPSVNPNKAKLQIMVNGSVETESKSITNIEKEKRYVKITPTRYQTNIVLKTKRKGKVPITAYYND